MNKNYIYSLRYNLVPGFDTEQKTAGLIEYCKKYEIYDIIFFIGAEEYNKGHITLEQAKPYVETIKKAKDLLAPHGITVSLNPWCSLGHGDRGRNLAAGQNFSTMVDVNEKKSDFCVCPLDSVWKEYFINLYKYYAEEISPKTLWIEDDYRLHNHAPLEFGGCFCDRHMQKYCEFLGKNISIKEFIEGMYNNTEDNIFRKAFFTVNRKLFNELSTEIGQALKPYNVQIGLMTSNPKVYSIEGRDNISVFEAFSANKNAANRIHLPSYAQQSPILYAWNFNDVSMLSRALCPENIEIMPEIENFPHGLYCKSANFTRFQIESAQPLVCEGITLNLYDFCGNGVADAGGLGYGEALKNLKPYLNAVKSLNLKYNSKKGIVIPVSEFSALHTKVSQGKNLYELSHSDNFLGTYLNQLGFATRFSKEKNFKNEIVALSHQCIKNYSREEIEQLFLNNYILMEAGTVITLKELGMLNLAGISSYEIYPEHKGMYSFEKFVFDKREFRLPAQFFAGEYLKAEYLTDNVETITQMYDYNENYVGEGTVIVNGNICIIPYLQKDFPFGLLNLYRHMVMEKVFSVFRSCGEIFYTLQANLIPYVFCEKQYDIAFLINFSDDSYENINIFTNQKYKHIEVIDTDNTVFQNVSFVMDGFKISINKRIKGMSTMALKLLK